MAFLALSHRLATKRSRALLLGVVALVVLASACTSPQTDDAGMPSVTQEDPGPDAPSVPPRLPDVREQDRDGDRIDDRLTVAGRLDDAESVDVEIVLKRAATRADLARFRALGGSPRHVFRAVSHGWTGRIPRSKVSELARELGSALHLVAAPTPLVRYLDEATRAGRVRPVWAPGFAGSASGFSGASNITIAIVDTGVDASHTDLAGRMDGWKDYTADAVASPHDVGGHGTHVAGIATGTGAAFAAANGTLTFTASGDASALGPGQAYTSPLHTPSYFAGAATALGISATATFIGGPSATLGVYTSGDASGWGFLGSATGTSPLIRSSLASNAGAARVTPALVPLAQGALSTYAVSAKVTNYPGVGDGFNALRGVAPGCKWYGAKVFRDDGGGDTNELGAALDDLVAIRKAHDIKVVNLSLGTNSPNPALRAKVNTLVDNGIVTVVAAGNDGPAGVSNDPARAAQAITVGATNDVNELTAYTSVGVNAGNGVEDRKPDILAPGGSTYRSYILSADSNTADGELASYPDLSPNDYAHMMGTSMAAPVVTGAAALVIDALAQKGRAWNFDSGAHARLVKNVLLATATETGAAREGSNPNGPTLGRAAAPKDIYEGFGQLNTDAAIEAVTVDFAGTIAGTVGSSWKQWERRAWARRIPAVVGTVVDVSLTASANGDFDVYLYAETPDGFGDPVIKASSTSTTVGATETLRYTSSKQEGLVLVVKHVLGTGSFTLTGTANATCGNGTVDPGEACDPQGSFGCCTVDCQLVANGTACDDGNACTEADVCAAGKCVGTGACAADAGAEAGSGPGDAGAPAQDAGSAPTTPAPTAEPTAPASGAPAASLPSQTPASATASETPRPAASEAAGCGCKVEASRHGGAAGLALPALAALFVARRRRLTSRCTRDRR